jgi:Xaa-Pro aminopeptidase
MLQVEYCRKRQKRLAAETLMFLDAVVVTHVPHVYYLSGHWPFWQHAAAAILDRNGKLTLITANKPAECKAADEVRSYEANRGSLRLDQPMSLAMPIMEVLQAKGCKRVGIDASAAASQVMLMAEGSVQFMPIDATIHQLRRKKEADELALMRKAIDCTTAMYRRAKEILRPGLGELEMFAELHKAAVLEAGEPLVGFLGNDYACGVGGGPARGGKVAQAGQIYVLDLGPCYRGYYSDNCRSFAVDGKPTDAQMKAWEVITGVFPIVESMAWPGVKCKEISAAVDAHYRKHVGKGLPHHLGHGVGLNPHEHPYLYPSWDDTLAEGDVFTAEPGLYGAEINGGMRIENNYLVTATGVERILEYPMELA